MEIILLESLNLGRIRINQALICDVRGKMNLMMCEFWISVTNVLDLEKSYEHDEHPRVFRSRMAFDLY